jgi:uncharacterized membrane protein YkgB
MIGSFKFFAFEAGAIQPLVGSSPLLAWLYDVFEGRWLIAHEHHAFTLEP